MQANRQESENELLGQIARRSETALARLYDRYARLLYSLILAIVREPAEAEEVLQETFLQVWQKAGAFDAGRGTAYRWLVTLARSRAIDRTRGRSFSQRAAMEEALDEASAGLHARGGSQLEAVLVEERASVVRRALGRLPEAQQQIMHLAYFLGHTQSEIASNLGIPLGTVKTRMRQALLSLHGLLGPEVQP